MATTTTGNNESSNSPSAAASVQRKTWSAEEDSLLIEYIKTHGEGRWTSLPLKAGLKRRGKSCRLRWFNYLHPNIKRGNFSEDEEELIIRLHRLLGNRWSLIAKRLPGRTDNDVKNYWNTHLCKKLKENATTSTPQTLLKNAGTKNYHWKNTVAGKVENNNGVTVSNGENIEKFGTCENQTTTPGFCEVEKIMKCMEEEESYHQLQYLQSNEELLSLCSHFPCGQFSQHDVLLVGADPDMNNLFYPDSLSLMFSDDFCNF